VIFVDLPRWPGRGRLWSHLVSDVSFAELHVFAEALGVPRRGFDRDHYDIPEGWYAIAVWLGAHPVTSREIVTALAQAGLRRPKRRGSTAPDLRQGRRRLD
jgi:Protein of unknown function (DUF4031)